MRAVAVGLFVLVAGCGGSVGSVAPPPRVVATRGPTLVLGGVRAADYAVPGARPLGHVEIASFGVTTLRPLKGLPATPMLQLRLVVANTSGEIPWSIDARDIAVDLGAAGQSRPAMVNVDAGAPPVIAVTRGERRTVDLYYPLPADAATAGQLPRFAVLWQVDTGKGVVAWRTVFRREEMDDDALAYEYAPRHLPETAYSYDYEWYPDAAWQGSSFPVGIGAAWWYDPLYPAYAFRDHVAFQPATGAQGRPVAGVTARFGAQWALAIRPAPRAVPAAMAAGRPAAATCAQAPGPRHVTKMTGVAARVTAVHHGRRAGAHRFRAAARARHEARLRTVHGRAARGAGHRPGRN